MLTVSSLYTETIKKVTLFFKKNAKKIWHEPPGIDDEL